MTVPVAARSKAWVCGRLPAEIAGSKPIGGMEVGQLWVLCVLSGRGLCDELITRPQESYRLWCVVVSDLETSAMKRSGPTGGLLRPKNETQRCNTHFRHLKTVNNSLQYNLYAFFCFLNSLFCTWPTNAKLYHKLSLVGHLLFKVQNNKDARHRY